MTNPSSSPGSTTPAAPSLPRAAIVAIGTELTQGQITNRNATWISEKLTARGIEVVHHAVVPDDRAMITAAFEHANRQADLVFVTGGLGPTTDDITRDCLAHWSERPLEFNEDAWKKIVQLLEKRGIEVAPSNRVQCFFPKGSVILKNLQGTADGFRFTPKNSASAHPAQVFALPGPPREGAYLWDLFVESWLDETFGKPTPPRLESWSCLGKSESSLGEIVETAVAGFGVKTGYRASPPYVEVKVWIPETLSPPRTLELLTKLGAELAPYSIARNGEDIVTPLFAVLERIRENRGTTPPITFLDFGSEGVLTERILAALKSDAGRRLQPRIEMITRFLENADLAAYSPSTDKLVLGLFPKGQIAVVGPSGIVTRALPTPYVAPELADRLRRYRVEMAIKSWTEILQSSTPLDS